MADITEREAWNRLQEALLAMRDSARALALLRRDQRWLAVAGIADRCKDSCTTLFTKSTLQGSRPVVTPPGQSLILPESPNFKRRSRD